MSRDQGRQLNPHAVEWSGQSNFPRGMGRGGMHVNSFYGGQNYNVQPMSPPYMNMMPQGAHQMPNQYGGQVGMNVFPGRGGMHQYYNQNRIGGNHYQQPAMPHQAMAHQGYQQPPPQPIQPPHMTATPLNRPPRPSPVLAAPQVAPSFIKMKVIAVCGFQCVGKTRVAKAIAEEKKFTYISLKPPTEGEAPSPTPLERLAPLLEVLERKSSIPGLVIDDMITKCKYEPYYVDFLLQKYGFKIDVVVMLESELEFIMGRPNFDDTLAEERILHPESNEFCARQLVGQATVVVYCMDKTTEAIVEEATKEVQQALTRENPVELVPVELCEGCKLVCDPALVTEVLTAEAEKLGIELGSLPFSEPTYLLEYEFFAQKAFQLSCYMVSPWISGDKVTLIGYGKNIYLHLPTYNILFLYESPPEALVALLAPSEPGTADLIFSFEATLYENVLYVSDLLFLHDKVCKTMLLQERVVAMREALSSLGAEDRVQLLKWYPVNQIQECIKAYEAIPASGVLFTNPRPLLVGAFDNRNFLYPLENKKTVEVRIWGCQTYHHDDQLMWLFSAYVSEAGYEKLVNDIPVQVADSVVEKVWLNNGNIVECTLEDVVLPSKGKKNPRQVTKRFIFKNRRPWLLNPTTSHRQETYTRDPAWPRKSFIPACESIPYKGEELLKPPPAPAAASE